MPRRPPSTPTRAVRFSRLPRSRIGSPFRLRCPTASCSLREPMTSIKSVRFHQFKGLGNFQLTLEEMNVLVGANNAGKSTVLSALKSLAVSLRKAGSRRPERVPGPEGELMGWRITEDILPMSTQNVHTDYEDLDTNIEFTFTNKRKLILFFPKEGGCTLLYDNCPAISNPAQFKQFFPFTISYVPTLGPVEEDERLLLETTVRSDILTHRASRQFRNYWHHYPENFERFASLLRSSWPSMDIRRPELIPVTGGKPKIAMFCSEKRMDREIFWAGFGFQVWCQMLTHISDAQRRNANLLVLDEPEIYLHPELQRQLLILLRGIGIDDVVLATHSTEIMAEASPSEIVVIDKTKQHAKRLRDVGGVQAALDSVGSIQNITLAQLARTQRVIFTEGDKDFRLICRFARILDLDELASGLGLTAVQSEGFDNWEKVQATAWGLEKILEGAALKIGAIFDRDFRCDLQIADILSDMKLNMSFAHIHKKKEIENYLLNVAVLQRALQSSLNDRARRTGDAPTVADSVGEILKTVTEIYRADVFAQWLAHELRYMKIKSPAINEATVTTRVMEWFERAWLSLDERLAIVPGKDVLSAFRARIQELYHVSLSDAKIISAFRPSDVPADFCVLLNGLNDFRKGNL
ncbi:ATP-dependent nuclease [Nannocystaceae bacterium ST9]